MNQVAVVTGSSRGVGAAAALRLARDGYSVCVNYRVNQNAAESSVVEILHLGANAIAMQADVSNEKDVKHLFNVVDRELGPIPHW